ncbi:MAG: formylglycine-generating enzyme family protein [Treponema sp.]|nr:formylglycine-generating enzyme family protein [Treponema sp.]
MEKARQIIYFSISLLPFFFYMSCTNGLSFYGNVDYWREKAQDKAPPPVITIDTQPTAVTNVTAGSINGNLSVSASATLDATLNYHWYSNTTNSYVGGSLISGAVNRSFNIPTTLTFGTYYYFCEVSASSMSKESSLRSNVVKVSVSGPVITIDTQPAAVTNLTAGSISGNLAVSANVTMGASLSYQWYSNTMNSNTGGTVITGATSTSFPIPTGITKTTIYFCEVRANLAAPVRTNPAIVILTSTSTSSAAIVMVSIPAGSFTMGSPTSEPGRDIDETQHTVTLTNGFSIGKYPVTQGQYKAVMSDINPSSFKTAVLPETNTDNRPVENVSWYDALVFCNKLSDLEDLTPAYSIGGSTNTTDWGTVPTSNNTTWNNAVVVSGTTGYRLPTEAQWEYACRAGTTTAFNWGTNTISSSQANYDARTVDACNLTAGTTYLGRTTSVVGLGSLSYLANAWGLYDMHGNVWEWCWDWYGSYTGDITDPTGAVSGSLRVIRGGSWNNYGQFLRSAFRGYYNPYGRSYNFGFRVVCP